MNEVVNGDYKGKKITQSWNNVAIILPFFKTAKISSETVSKCQVQNGNGWIDIKLFEPKKSYKKYYIIVVLFKDGKCSTLQVNRATCKAIKNAFSSNTRNRKNGSVIAALLMWFITTGLLVYMDDRFQLSKTIEWFPVVGLLAPVAVACLAFWIKPFSLIKQALYRKVHNRKKRENTDSDIIELQESLERDLEERSSFSSSQTPIAVTKDMHAAAKIIFETGQASVSMIQRKMALGYSRAAHIIDDLEAAGIIGPFKGSIPRKILISKNEYLSRYQIVDSLPRKFLSTNIDHSSDSFDYDQIVRDEKIWRKEQTGLSPVEYELQTINSMDGYAFEKWCAELLEKNGFTDVEVTKGSGDQGVDVLAVKEGIRYAIQCKCYSSDLGNKPIQEVHAGKDIYGCQIGVVMTNRYFTFGAKELAAATGTLLWDKDKLKDMLTTAAPRLGPV